MCWWLSCFDAVALRVHGVDIHDAVAVGEEIDAAVPEHGVRGGAGVVGREGNGFVLAVEAPDVFGRAAFVAFGLAGLREPAGEEEGVAVGRSRRLRRPGRGERSRVRRDRR